MTNDHRRSCTWDHRWSRHASRRPRRGRPRPARRPARFGQLCDDSAGYKVLLKWLESFGEVTKIGIEGTGSYGSGLSRYLRRVGVTVIEVDRPNREEHRRSGKSDPLDAVEAARAALSGRASGHPKSRDGAVEAIRVLVVAKRSARQARVKALTQMRHLGYSAPEQLRPRSVGPLRCRPDTAAALVMAAGDNPERLHSEAAWAHLCGAGDRGRPALRCHLRRGTRRAFWGAFHQRQPLMTRHKAVARTSAAVQAECPDMSPAEGAGALLPNPKCESGVACAATPARSVGRLSCTWSASL